MAEGIAGKQVPASVHLMGICGTAMTALAGVLQARGARVSGSDSQAYPPMSDQLATLGIPFQLGYRAENLPADVDLVVVGNVIQAGNPEAEEMRRRGLPHLSMAEAVYRFAIGGRRTAAVVGTHGKTTTTALAAHLLTALGADPGFLIGGIAHNFHSNFRVGGGDVFVIEGDEYDTAYFDKTPKFFKYKPEIVLFTSLEFDHADIYADLDALRRQFAALLASLPPGGRVIACADDPEVVALLPQAACPVETYGFSAGASLRLSALHDDGQRTRFTSTGPGGEAHWAMPLPGRHNALNAAAVVALSRHLGYADVEAARAMETFSGVRRRQEVRGQVNGITVLDDFAHHPTAVASTIEAIRGRYPGQRLWAVFEPRSFTARSDRFREAFVAALSGADRVVLAPPYQSGYSAGVAVLDTAAAAGAIASGGGWARAAANTEEILALLSGEARPGDVVLIMSNGGFDNIHQRLLEALANGGTTAP